MKVAFDACDVDGDGSLTKDQAIKMLRGAVCSAACAFSLDGSRRFQNTETNDENAFGKWLLFRVARSGTRKEGGFTEAQLREFEEDGNIDDVDTARKNLGMVATETLASYGVDKVERTLAERPNRQAKVPSSSGFDLKDIGDKLTSSFDEMFGERD